MTGESDQGSSWATFIPEFFFDVISRIPPGMFLSAFLVWRWVPFLGGAGNPIQIADAEHFPYTVAFVALIVSGHTLGIFITPLGDLVRRSYLKRIWISLKEGRGELYNDLYRRWGDDSHPETSLQWHAVRSSVYAQIYRHMHDWTKAAHPKADVLLAKMSAESAVCENAIGALSVAVVVEMAAQPWQNWDATVLPFTLSVGYLYYAAQWRYRRLLSGQFSYYLLAKESSLPHRH